MASGMGVKGTIGRCYGFFADFKQCQEDGREALRNGSPDAVKQMKSCIGPREDYFECLHQKKTHARIQTVLNEELKQKKESKSSSSGH